MTARRRSLPKRKPDEAAMAAADHLLHVTTELHVAFSGMKPRSASICEKNVVVGFLQQAAEVVPLLLEAMAEMAVAIGLDLEAAA